MTALGGMRRGVWGEDGDKQAGWGDEVGRTCGVLRKQLCVGGDRASGCGWSLRSGVCAWAGGSEWRRVRGVRAQVRMPRIGGSGRPPWQHTGPGAVKPYTVETAAEEGRWSAPHWWVCKCAA